MWRQNLAPAYRLTVFIFCLSNVVKGRCIFNCKNPHTILENLTTLDFRSLVKYAIIRLPRMIFDRYILLNTKQLNGETVKQKIELAENCNF